MKATELREKSAEQLNEQLLTLLRDQFNLRMQKATGQLGQSHLLKQVKRDIARVKTVLNQKGGKCSWPRLKQFVPSLAVWSATKWKRPLLCSSSVR